MLTRVARHHKEGEGLGDAPRAVLCFQVALCPFPPPRLEQEDVSGAFIHVHMERVCKAELPSDYHGLAAW